ncbi:MAG: YfiR family protein [Marinilabiliaceae bacterium]|nr:YfiR family protein [Marinilabiliaceae bacterium]
MKKILFMCLLAIVGIAAQAQMAKFQALYILQFAKNTSWPSDDNSKPFVITVVGDNALASELKSIANTKTIGVRKITVTESATATGLVKSDIIFLGESKSSQIGALVSAQANNRVLIVSGAKGMCAHGAGISFVPEGGKLNFEIHEGNIAKHGLKVGQKIVSLGRQVF